MVLPIGDSPPAALMLALLLIIQSAAGIDATKAQLFASQDNLLDRDGAGAVSVLVPNGSTLQLLRIAESTAGEHRWRAHCRGV